MLLLVPLTFCMGMMFPLGLSLWRRHADLLPFFWSANGITSMLASALGMLLSIEFGIAKTYALGVCIYAVCAVIVLAGWRAQQLRPSELNLETRDKAAAASFAPALVEAPTQPAAPAEQSP